MQKVKSYIITWRPDENKGQFHGALADGKGADLPIDNPKEASFLLNLSRHEPEVHFDAEHRLIVTGVDIPGQEYPLVLSQVTEDENYKQIKEYVLSVVGIGEKTADALLEYTNVFQNFDTAEKLSEKLELKPSSDQVDPLDDIIKDIDESGPDRVRGLLYMCTRSAIEHNRPCEKLYEGLLKNGKTHQFAALAVMDKLVQQVYECVATRTMFVDE